jgi:transposase-like protein
LQRCVVHFYRNIFSYVPRPKMREVAAMLNAIHASEDVQAAREKALQVVTKLRAMRLTKAAQAVETGVETLAYYQFPEVTGDGCAPIIHWSGSCVRSPAIACGWCAPGWVGNLR